MSCSEEGAGKDGDYDLSVLGRNDGGGHCTRTVYSIFISGDNIQRSVWVS